MKTHIDYSSPKVQISLETLGCETLSKKNRLRAVLRREVLPSAVLREFMLIQAEFVLSLYEKPDHRYVRAVRETRKYSAKRDVYKLLGYPPEFITPPYGHAPRLTYFIVRDATSRRLPHVVTDAVLHVGTVYEELTLGTVTAGSYLQSAPDIDELVFTAQCAILEMLLTPQESYNKIKEGYLRK